MPSRLKHSCSAILTLSLLTACASTPPKNATARIDSQSKFYQELASTPLPSHLPIPVKGISADQLTDTWGNARSHGRSHEGIDILSKRGTPVYSTTDGIVSRISSYGAGGNAITVVGYALSQHYYAHLESFGKYRIGDTVKVGDTLGYVGSTGNATTTHLHYGIYLSPNRTAVNPYPYLR
ncbi:M23 family metallopeptidase [Aquirhabdus sp.]|uniref:M23 family metallopeptidase n=1 Tax=Aquirhabdus sp. TaxID=2824160 RepID=UPI00396C442E